MKLLILLAAAAASALAQHPVDAYNVVWTSPSKDSSGSMPLGNGDTGLNVWTEESGDIVFYISKSDAWAETTRLVKVGRVRLRMNPNPFAGGAPFKQTLNLKAGEIAIEGGKPGSKVKVVLWVDAFSPVIRVDADMEKATEVQAQLERWRDQPRILEGEEIKSA